MREILRASNSVASLSARDRALAVRLALGCVAAEGILDRELNGYLRRPSALEPRVRDALRVSAFECAYLFTPPSACVSQGVELVRSVAPRAAGMANAVLRRMVGELRPQVEAARDRCMAALANVGEAGAAEPLCYRDDLVLVSGLPAWLVTRITEARGLRAACELCLAQLEPAPTYVAANRLLFGEEELRPLLDEQGFEPVAAALPEAFVLGSPAGLHASELVTSGKLIISDLAAQAVARIAVPAEGQRVLEVGQGRGTKTLLMASVAAAMAGEGAHAQGMASFVGVESVSSKVSLCNDRLRAAGLGDVATCVELDGRKLGGRDLPAPVAGEFDVVLLDAPCSGVGTMRRHPEIPWSLDEGDVTPMGALPVLQGQLLAAASERVGAGGLLAYATCSVLPEEDERVVDSFLASGAGSRFRRVSVLEAPGLVALRGGARAWVAERVMADGSLLSLPKAGSSDGHFCALLRREG